MKKTKIDKRLSAYLDGALAGGRRSRVERDLERDPALREALKRTQSLGRLVRDSWTEGPPAPPTDFLLASLRSELHAIDRERRARPAWQQAFERARVALGHWFGPVPIATSAAAAFLFALAFLQPALDSIPGMDARLPVATPSSAAPQRFEPAAAGVSRPSRSRSSTLFAPTDFSTQSDQSIYDMSPIERPTMLFQGKDGSTILWLLDDDGLSRWLESMDLWG